MIKRYVADKDTSITNAYEEDLSTRATTCNMGGSDVLEVFSAFGRVNTSSVEKMRILINFPISTLYSDIVAGTVPDSGVSYYLRLFDVAHQETTPETFTLDVQQVSRSWDEGHGMDMEGFLYDGDGASWSSASNAQTAWTTAGGDFVGTALTASFTSSADNLELDISSFVSSWITYEASGTGQRNYGLVIKLSGSMEDCLASSSYYTKRFSARTSEYYYSQPIIEARFNDSKTDDRGNFYAKSNLVSDNSNKLYFYNRPRYVWSNVPNTPMVVRFFDSSAGTGSITPVEGTPITATLESTGKYYITATITTTEEIIYDRWYDSLGNCLWTGTIDVHTLSAFDSLEQTEYVGKITNLKSEYKRTETNVRFNLFLRLKDWTPTIYTAAQSAVENTIVEKVYYQVRRTIDDLIVLDYNKSSQSSGTLMSYDKEGNYFYLDMSMFEKDYQYEIAVGYEIGSEFRVLPQTFKFRIGK